MSAAPSPIRVLLVDDHLIVRQGLKQVLGDPAHGEPALQVRAEADSGPEALRQAEALGGPAGLDLVLLDIALPGLDGLELLRELRQRWPALPVLMLSTYPEKQYAVRCIKLGAAGYLNKSADADDMVAALRKVAVGGRYLSPATAEALAGAVARGTAAPSTPAAVMAAIDALSHREHQVFRLLTSGHSVSEIGAQLGLAPNTVSTYRARILDKTGARNDVELALLARGVAGA